MKKTALKVTYLTVLAALVCLGCGDDGVQNKNPEVDGFMSMFVGGEASYNLSVNITPNGSGSVLRSPDNTSYKARSQVTLTATASTGYFFTGWTGAVNDTAAAITVTMNGDMALTANFISMYDAALTLTVNSEPGDGGSVSFTPNKVVYKYGDSVTVTATPANSYVFTGWSGASNSTEETTKIAMDNYRETLTATFSRRRYTLTVNIVPSGAGSVSFSPEQTNNMYIEGTEVTVTATAASGYVFRGWSDTPTSTASLVITIDGNKTLTANFWAIDSRDNKIYKTVKIGNQTWMAENLNYDTANGLGSWCYNDKPDSCKKYGRLYSWYTAMGGATSSATNPSGVQGVCPAGWHLPSRAEWGELAIAADGTGTAGKTLKSTNGWNYDGNGTDKYVFSALPGGVRHNYSDDRGVLFENAGNLGYWWTSTHDSGTSSGSHFTYLLGMTYSSNSVVWALGIENNGSGYSVRCVRDD
jgi:uncharacterized protein (TIGR02145 family)/uncharacterized repeat protein (TIGR02543 family)